MKSVLRGECGRAIGDVGAPIGVNARCCIFASGERCRPSQWRAVGEAAAPPDVEGDAWNSEITYGCSVEDG